MDASVKAINGEKVKVSGVPVAGRFYGEVDADQVEMSRFYEKSEKLDKIHSSLTAAKTAGDGEALTRILEAHPEAALIRAP